MNTVKCPNCGNENLSTNIRCEKCGKQLITEDQMQAMDLEPSLNIQQDPVLYAASRALEELIQGIARTIGGPVLIFVSSMIIFDNITKFLGISFIIYGIVVLICGILLIIQSRNMNKNIIDYVDEKLNMDELEKSEKNFEKVVKNIEKVEDIFTYISMLVFFIVFIKAWV